MERRRFEHFFVELSVALGELAPRYALWLRIGELGLNPESLGREAVTGFCRRDLQPWLAEHGLNLAPRKLRRLIRAVSRFDPRYLTPEERMTALFQRIASGG